MWNFIHSKFVLCISILFFVAFIACENGINVEEEAGTENPVGNISGTIKGFNGSVSSQVVASVLLPSGSLSTLVKADIGTDGKFKIVLPNTINNSLLNRDFAVNGVLQSKYPELTYTSNCIPYCIIVISVINKNTQQFISYLLNERTESYWILYNSVNLTVMGSGETTMNGETYHYIAANTFRAGYNLMVVKVDEGFKRIDFENEKSYFNSWVMSQSSIQ